MRCFDDLIRMNAEGISDSEIARRTGYDRHTIGKHRRRLGLPDQSKGTQARAAIAAGVKRQLLRLGIPALSQLRVEAWRKSARDLGWPETIDGRPVNRRELAILEAFRLRGPMTRIQLAESIGMEWLGSRRSMKCRGRGGSYLAGLMRAGIVVSLGRAMKGEGKGSTTIYSLALEVERNDVGRDQAE